MRRRLYRVLKWWCIGGAAVVSGCIFDDPDVGLRAALSFGSDLAIFLLENATAGL
jgi:hypothetical protein